MTKGRGDDPAYWEALARDFGWDAERVKRAGEVGSLAISKGLSEDEALDVVIAGVRDGKDVRIGPSRWRRLTRNEGLPAVIGGVLLFLAVGIGRTGESVATSSPLLFTAVLVLEAFFVIGGLARGAWRLSLLGLAISAAAVAVFISRPAS